MSYDPMKPSTEVSEAKFAQVGEVCPNEACRDYGRRDGRVVKFGQNRQGRQWCGGVGRSGLQFSVSDQNLTPTPGGTWVTKMETTLARYGSRVE